MWPYLPKWVTWILSAIVRFCSIVRSIDVSLKWCKNWSKLVHWFWNCDNEKSPTPTIVIWRNRQVKFQLYSRYWRVACFKHLRMTLINFLYSITSGFFSDVEKTGETDFVEKPKSIYYYGTPFGKVAKILSWLAVGVPNTVCIYILTHKNDHVRTLKIL